MSEKIQTMRTISDWLEQYNWKIYYNQRNPEGKPVFKTKGSQAKPDLLAKKNNYTFLIEVKPGAKHRDLLDGFDQTIKYAGEYYTGRVQYHTNITEKIDAFVLATKYSPYGYLYSLEAELPTLNYTSLKELYGMTEKPITHTFTRLLWRTWHKGLAHEYYEQIRIGERTTMFKTPVKPKVGVLLAKTTTQGEIERTPYLYLNSNKFQNIGW